MPVLLNPRHEAYAQERFKGFSKWKSALNAGFHRNSVRLLEKRPDVQARIEELRGAPCGVGTLIQMWQALLQRAILMKDLAVEQKCLRQITILSGAAFIEPLRKQAKNKESLKAKKQAKRAHAHRTEAAEEEDEEPENDGDPDAQPAPSIQALDRLLGRLDDDARNTAKEEAAGLLEGEPAQDARGDYRHG